MEGPPGDETEGMPRWVKGFAIVAVALALLGIIALALGDGDHGPGRHAPVAAPRADPLPGPPDDPSPDAYATERGGRGGHTAW